MHGSGDILGAAPEFDNRNGLGDKFGYARPDHVHTENAVGALVRQNLHESVAAVGRQGPPIRSEVKYPGISLMSECW